MKVLVACEESQAVCIEFRKQGFDAYSCDIKECSGGYPEWHIKGDVFEVINEGWDLMIAHPPCTYLSYAGTRHWNNPGRVYKRISALKFFADMLTAPIPHIAIENPLGCASTAIRMYDQIIEPYHFGDRYLKRTCLWLENLPPLLHAAQQTLFEDATHTLKPDPIYIDKKGKKRHFTEATGGYHGEGNSTLKRSKTFPGIAAAMAVQWGNYILNSTTAPDVPVS